MNMQNHTVRLLTEMRDEIRERFEQVDRRFEQVDRRFEQVDRRFEQMEQGIRESQMRLSTEILAVAGALQETKGLVMQQSAIKHVVADHERRLQELEQKP